MAPMCGNEGTVVYPGALLMAIYHKGLDDNETSELTAAMAKHSFNFTWPKSWRHLVVDKHSSGGVGDKISLVLVPVLMALGLKVPMVSGYKLQFTGGTLDKMESVPGVRVDATTDEVTRWVTKNGGCIVSQSKEINPADRLIYATRDSVHAVDCLPLIIASIASKKLVEGLSAMVFDVKTGRGALSKDEAMAREMALRLVGAEDHVSPGIYTGGGL
ncbi:TYMP [Cordylochernes scorpioides]|uniref:TYMP n=1 Tax=Cordylochernes scorpioides TaxID=51811 RepID=A0ABY6LIX9_9ARAC|nr:TYMP [Cordylochernes scorpioides]